MELEEDSLNVNARNILDYDEDLYVKMMRYPLEAVAIFDIVLMDMVVCLIPLWDKHIQRNTNLKMKSIRSKGSLKTRNGELCLQHEKYN